LQVFETNEEEFVHNITSVIARSVRCDEAISSLNRRLLRNVRSQ
jgi:hypothetical protein